MLVYPNKLEFPVMEDFGRSPLPLGMMEVTVLRDEGLPASDFLGKSDPYVEACCCFCRRVLVPEILLFCLFYVHIGIHVLTAECTDCGLSCYSLRCAKGRHCAPALSTRA